MRLVADAGTIILAVSTIIGLFLRRVKRRRGNLDHIRELERECAEADELIDKMTHREH